MFVVLLWILWFCWDIVKFWIDFVMLLSFVFKDKSFVWLLFWLNFCLIILKEVLIFIYFDIILFIVLVVVLIVDVCWIFIVCIFCFWFLIWVFSFNIFCIRRESVVFFFSGLRVVVVCFGMRFLWKRRVVLCVIKYKINKVCFIEIVILLMRFFM